MPANQDLPPHDDIREALSSAARPPETEGSHHAMNASPADTLVDASAPPWMDQTRFLMARCGYMAEKYPWQTTGALLLTVGCGWLCNYFGWTVMAGLVLYAVTADE